MAVAALLVSFLTVALASSLASPSSDVVVEASVSGRGEASDLESDDVLASYAADGGEESLHRTRLVVDDREEEVAEDSIEVVQLLSGRDFARVSDAVTADDAARFRMATGMSNYQYLLVDKATRQALIVDGNYDGAGLEAAAARRGLRLVGYLATHFHYDHVGAADRGLEGMRHFTTDRRGDHGPPLPALVSEGELEETLRRTNVTRRAHRPGGPGGGRGAVVHGMRNGTIVRLGRRLWLQFLVTPGHSPGGLTVLVGSGQAAARPPAAAGTAGRVPGKEGGDGLTGALIKIVRAQEDSTATNDGQMLEEEQQQQQQQQQQEEEEAKGKAFHVITGDTLFPGSCGRVDLPESDAGAMWSSLQHVLAKLDPALRVWPGHSYGGSSSTIGAERVTGLLRPIPYGAWMRQMGGA